MLYCVDGASFLASAALDAVIYIGAGRLALDNFIDIGWADFYATAYPGTQVIVDLYGDPDLLALPFPHVSHDLAVRSTALGTAGSVLSLSPYRG